jgi:hypothetical protein
VPKGHPGHVAQTHNFTSFFTLAPSKKSAGVKQFEWGSFRVPLSGSVSGFEGDVQFRHWSQLFTAKCKSRGASFSSLYKWFAGNDFLVVKRDREDPLIIINARKLAPILAQKPRTRKSHVLSLPPGFFG